MPKAPRRADPDRPASASPPPPPPDPAPEVVEAERLTPAAEALLFRGLDPAPGDTSRALAPVGSRVVGWVQRHPILAILGASGVAAVVGLVGGIAIAAPAADADRPRHRRRPKRRRHARARARA